MTTRYMHGFYTYSGLGSRDRIVQLTLFGHILHINAPICLVHVAQIFRGSDLKVAFTTMN